MNETSLALVTTRPSPVGTLTLQADSSGEKLTGLWIAGQKYHGLPAAPGGSAAGGRECRAIQRAGEWLERYFAGENLDVAELPLAPQGTPFRQLVWAELQAIPYGEVTTYGEIARKVATQMGRAQMSAQAVGGAVGHNPLAIVIPCHRVVGTGGALTGYAGGMDAKRYLLSLEGHSVS